MFHPRAEQISGREYNYVNHSLITDRRLLGNGRVIKKLSHQNDKRNVTDDISKLKPWTVIPKIFLNIEIINIIKIM